MARLILISSATYKPDINAVGDIVGIFDDDHVFSTQEKELYNIVEVPNLTREEFRMALKLPITQTVIDSFGNEYNMWRNSVSDPWKKLVRYVKYPWTAAGVNAEQELILRSHDVPKETKIAMLEQFGNNLSFQPENRTTMININIYEEQA